MTLQEKKNRQIRFRAWHFAEEKMCEVQIINFGANGAFLVGVSPSTDQIVDIDGKDFVVYAPQGGRFCDSAEFRLLEYTGQKDKNGKKCFEGDLIENRDGDVRQIIYGEVGFEMRLLSGRKDDNATWYYKFEIVGNIYENADQLPQKAAENNGI